MDNTTPKICSNCAYINTCKHYNGMLNEEVSEDYSCSEFEEKLKW